MRAPLLSSLSGAAPPWTPAGLEDPYPWFAEALSGPSVVYDDRADVWHVLHYDDVRAFLRDATVWSVSKRMERVPPEQRIIRLLMSDPPGHAKLREHFSRAYRPRRVAALDTDSVECFEAGDAECAIRDAGRDDDGAAGHF